MTDSYAGDEMPLKKATPDFLELLAQNLAIRVKDILMEDIMKTISENLPTIEASSVEGLDKYFQTAFEEYTRNVSIDVEDVEGIDRYVEKIFSNGDLKLDAEQVEGLDEYIKETLKQATISIDL